MTVRYAWKQSIPVMAGYIVLGMAGEAVAGVSFTIFLVGDTR